MLRPFVYINMAMTVDGKITSARRDYPRFTSPRDRENMDRLRAEADALLVGAGTVRADNPKLHVRTEEMQERRRRLGKPDALHKVIVTAGGRIDSDNRFFDESDGGDRVVATVEGLPEGRVEELTRRGVEVWRLGRESVDLVALLGRLRESKSVERLLCEGGGELNWALLREDLVDEIHVTIAPALLGGREAPTLLGGEGLSMKRQRRLRLVDLRREDDELYCRYRVVRAEGD